MLKKIILSVAIILSICSFSPVILEGNFNIAPDKHFPRWLKSENYRTDQTSGISYIGRDKNNNLNFLLADDIGKMHRLTISNDTAFNFTPIAFLEPAKKYLSEFPKMDFEEIVFDIDTKNIYVSIEGNGEEYLKYNGIFRLEFMRKNIYSDTIINVNRIKIVPFEKLNKYVKSNIGFEGLAVDKNYFYLGLEGILINGNFSDGTIIYIVDKSSLSIVKEISTTAYSITSVCALYSDEDLSVWGVDRNNRNIFHLNFDKELNVKNNFYHKFKTVIPSYREVEYRGSVESITMDDNDNIFMIDDPWHEVFIPDQVILNKLDEQTISNFKKFIPIIFKYNLE